MTTRIRVPIVLATAAAIGLLSALPVAAQVARDASGTHSVRRLGGSTRLTTPLRTVDQLKGAYGRPGMRGDIAALLTKAGMPSLAERVSTTVAEGRVREVTVAPGTTFEWMAFRHGSDLRVVETVRWDGTRPFAAFEFQVDDSTETFTFVVPQDCGNLTLARREPSRAAAAAKPEPSSVAVATRPEAPPMAAAVAPPPPPAPAPPPLAEVIQPAPVPAPARASWRPFVAAYVGKQRRQYDENDPAGLGTVFVPGFCDPLVGLKVGFEKRTSTQWSFAPAIGFAVNTQEGDRSTLFTDLEVNYNFAGGAYIGSGIGLWDVTHGDFLTPTALVNVGVPLWSSATGQALLFTVEGRLMLDRIKDVDSNYQFWGGLRWMFR